MICYKFPPMHSTSCVRTWAFYRGMREYFDTVHVISTTNRHILRQEVIDMEDAEVVDAKTWDYRTILQGRKGSASAVSNTGKLTSSGKLGQKLNASFPFLYLFGEGGWMYIRNAVQHGEELIDRENITHVFSTYTPYADHLVASKLKHKYPQLFWIADFRDLHVDPTQNNLFFRNHQEKVNRNIISGADMVTTVSSGLAEHLKAYHDNVVVLRNGIENAELRTCEGYTDKFTLCYTGSLFGEHRDPGILYEALSELCAEKVINQDDVRILYAGKDQQAWDTMAARFGWLDAVENKGLISRQEALELQCKSHVNVLLTYSSDSLTGNLTGKVFEYMAAGRSILVLVSGPEDKELNDIIEPHFGMVAYPDERRKVKSFLKAEYEAWSKGNHEDTSDLVDRLQPYIWSNMIRKFVTETGLTAEVDA